MTKKTPENPTNRRDSMQEPALTRQLSSASSRGGAKKQRQEDDISESSGQEGDTETFESVINEQERMIEDIEEHI